MAIEQYFSVLALFILFRETIEASIICGVLMQFLNRAKPSLKKAVWWGVAGGVAVSIVFGAIFISVYYTAQSNLFKGKNRDWFKGIISWIAAALITILAFAMLRFLGWEAKWKRRLEAAMAREVPDAAHVQPDAVEHHDGAAPAVAAPGEEDKGATATVSKDADGASGSSSETATAASRSDDTCQSAAPDSPHKSHTESTSPAAAPALASVSSKSDTAPALGKKSAGSDAAALAAPTDVEAPAAAAGTDTAALEAVDGRDMTPPTRKEFWKIWILVFTTVVREGIESVVFLGGLNGTKLTAIPLPAFVGITAGVLVGMILYYSGKQVKHIKWLVIGMAVVLFFMAAGQVNLGTDALMRAGMFGECSPWYDERPWFMVPMYDWSECCSDSDPNGTEPTEVQNRKRFFALARAIFGYQDKGTPLEIIIYCSYWGLIILIGIFKWWRGSLFDADFEHTRRVRKQQKEEARRAEAEAAKAAAEAEALGGVEAGEGSKEVGEGSSEGREAADAAEVHVATAAAPPSRWKRMKAWMQR